MAENWIEKLKRKIKVYYGKGTAVALNKGFTTLRTSAVEKGLRQGGLITKDLAKFDTARYGEKKKYFIAEKLKSPLAEKKPSTSSIRYVTRNGIKFPVRGG